jgi:hypothetical protein
VRAASAVLVAAVTGLVTTMPVAATVTSPIRVDVLVYGATPGGVVAAVTAARAGARTVVVEPGDHVGGIMSNGLGVTDIGTKSTIGGYAHEVFDRIKELEGTVEGHWRFEAHHAELALIGMLQGARVSVHLGQQLAPRQAVTRSGTRITTLRTASGRVYQAKIVIDASYTGDVLAAAGVRYTVGRESTAAYGESLAGVRPSRYLLTLAPTETLPFAGSAPGLVGSADARIQASNFRLCFSTDPANQMPFTKPPGYRERDYKIFLRYLLERAKAAGVAPRIDWILSIRSVGHQEFDVNDSGPMSIAVPSLIFEHPEADDATRLEIERQHQEFTQGLLYFLRYSASVPAVLRDALAMYGLCKDEFTTNGNWPRQLYLRESRRMIGAYVLRQADIQAQRTKPDIIGVGSYRIDSHYVSRWVTADGRVMVEGTMSAPYTTFAIPYRAITPARSEVTNLLVPVAASASHVAQSALRMEPHYLIMGEAAGEAAAIAVRSGRDVQAIDIAALQARLADHGAIVRNPIVTPVTRLRPIPTRRAIPVR